MVQDLELIAVRAFVRNSARLRVSAFRVVCCRLETSTIWLYVLDCVARFLLIY